ncbi:MAG: nucleoside triphosphate pyrophosphohydrolase [Muribaculaceae bacterium]|nr:nucleoside triphosphate pyrophosphohydrolase [Muribaculaceae bacterium]
MNNISLSSSAARRQIQLEAFGRMLDILDELRVKCPWDAKQTNESLRPNTIEETFELAEALSNNDSANIRKELGDVLLHIAFYSKIASEKGDFDIADVCNSLSDKLIFRHPHVFGDAKVESSEKVLENWEQIKLKEKGGNKTVLGGVPAALPALIKANRIQEKVRNVGFDWEEPAQVWDKVEEEMREVKAEIKSGDKDALEMEFGDLLFAVVNAARLYGVNPENALEKTNKKFIARFNYLEAECKKRGLNLKEMTLTQMDEIWNEAKSILNN